MHATWLNIAFWYVVIFIWLIAGNLKSMTPGCLLSVLFFPVTIPAFIVAIAFQHYFLQEYQLRRKMSACGRLLSRGEVPHRGTILVDSAAFNHARTRIWWTPDDVASVYPVPVSESGFGWQVNGNEYIWSPFEKWVWHTYLNPDSGRAKLVFGKVGGIQMEKIKSRFNGCAIIESHSNGKIFAEISGGSGQKAKPEASE